MKLKLWILTLLFFAHVNIHAGYINIAVAANVSYVIDALKKEFYLLHPNIKVKVVLGSSGKLTAQVKHGAPYGLFMSANMLYPNTLYQEGLAVTKPRVYAKGALAYLSSKKQDFSQGMKLTLKSSIKKIAVANPKTAPYGIATKEALENAGVYEQIKHKFVYGESISQTVSYAVMATDFGFIAKSSLYSPKMKRFKEGEHWFSVDTKLYTPIDQGIVILKGAKDDVEVKAFYDFMFSAKAQDILRNFGYTLP